MLKTFVRLLGEDAPTLRRYAVMAVFYGLLSGLTLITLVPLISHLLAGDALEAGRWLVALLSGVTACALWRRTLDKAGVAVGVAVLQGARQRVGDHVARLPVGWFSAQNSARLGHLITQGMMALAQLPAHVFTPVISGAVTPLVLVAALFALHWPLGVLALLALPVLVGVMLLTARLGHSADNTYQQNFAQTSQRMVEFAQAQSVLRAFNGSGGATRLLDQAIDQQRQSGQRLIYRSSLSAVFNAWAVQGIFCALLVAVALWCDALDAHEAIAACVALVLVCRYIEPLLEVASYGEILRRANAQLDEVHSILAEQPLPVAAQAKMPMDSSVELRNVSFRYAPDEPQVLRGVSLRIEPGSMTALIGPSGSGKTTLVRLLARFFDANRGQVLIGGVEVREMSEAVLAAQIRLGKPGASLAEIAAVAQQAGVAEIIARLPLGLHTPVGEGGARLSGGERQRIAIARALLKDAPILLVDEATAALDTYNQAAIADALARLRGRCTLIVIAHQLSTVAMADQILVLDDGEIVEQGTPAILAASAGRYAQFLAQRRAARGWRIA